MKVSFLTLGCKVNQAESGAIESALLESGHEVVRLSEKPDICIVNTCTVTGKSDYQSRQYVRRALRTGAQVYVTGCYSQLNPQEITAISPSIEVINNDNKLHIINKITNKSKTTTLTYTQSRSRAFIKIQDGCNHRCTYCTIHLARGRSRSYQQSGILAEINRVHDAGINEVVLTGVHIGLYGRDLAPKQTLNELLKAILVKTSIPRIRLSSLEANELDDELIEILDDQRICRHFHIPLQSADNAILRSMGRPYTRERYEGRVETLLHRFPGSALGTDVIVGFPGEDDASFAITHDFIRNTDFTYLHVFPYSKRKNTPAATYPDQVDSHTKDERVHVLRGLSNSKKSAYMEKHIGEILDVILETKKTPNMYTATSGNYLKVFVQGAGLVERSLVSVRITGTQECALVGMPIKRI